MQQHEGVWWAHAGECDNVAGELAESQATCAELSKERDELAASLANLEAEHANLCDAHASLKYAATYHVACQILTVPNGSQPSGSCPMPAYRPLRSFVTIPLLDPNSFSIRRASVHSVQGSK